MWAEYESGELIMGYKSTYRHLVSSRITMLLACVFQGHVTSSLELRRPCHAGCGLPIRSMTTHLTKCDSWLLLKRRGSFLHASHWTRSIISPTHKLFAHSPRIICLCLKSSVHTSSSASYLRKNLFSFVRFFDVTFSVALKSTMSSDLCLSILAWLLKRNVKP